MTVKTVLEEQVAIPLPLALPLPGLAPAPLPPPSSLFSFHPLLPTPTLALLTQWSSSDSGWPSQAAALEAGQCQGQSWSSSPAPLLFPTRTAWSLLYPFPCTTVTPLYAFSSWMLSRIIPLMRKSSQATPEAVVLAPLFTGQYLHLKWGFYSPCWVELSKYILDSSKYNNPMHVTLKKTIHNSFPTFVHVTL